MSKTHDIEQQNKLIREKYLNDRNFYLARITQSQVLLKVFEKYMENSETVHFYVTFQMLQVYNLKLNSFQRLY